MADMQGLYFPRYNNMGGGDPYAHVADQYASELHAVNDTQQQGYRQAAQTPTSIAQAFQQAYLQAKQQQIEEERRQQEAAAQQATMARQAAMDKYNFSKEVSNNYGSPEMNASLRHLGDSLGVGEDAYPKDVTKTYETPAGGPGLTQEASAGIGLPGGVEGPGGDVVGSHPAVDIPMPQEVSSTLTTPGVGQNRQAAIDKILGAKAEQDRKNRNTESLIGGRTKAQEFKQAELDIKQDLADGKLTWEEAATKYKEAQTKFLNTRDEWLPKTAQSTIDKNATTGAAASSNAASHAKSVDSEVEARKKKAEAPPAPPKTDPLLAKAQAAILKGARPKDVKARLTASGRGDLALLIPDTVKK